MLTDAGITRPEPAAARPTVSERALWQAPACGTCAYQGSAHRTTPNRGVTADTTRAGRQTRPSWRSRRLPWNTVGLGGL